MEREKSFVYTLILGASMLISLLLIGKMLLYEPAPIHAPHIQLQGQNETLTEQEDNKMVISAQAVTQLLAQALPEDLAISNLLVAMGADGSLTAQGTMQKQALESRVQNNMARSVLLFLPDSFTLKICCTAQCDKAGVVKLTPVTLTAGQLELPGSAVPEELVGLFNTALNDALRQALGEFSSIRLMDGAVELIP